MLEYCIYTQNLKKKDTLAYTFWRISFWIFAILLNLMIVNFFENVQFLLLPGCLLSIKLLTNGHIEPSIYYGAQNAKNHQALKGTCVFWKESFFKESILKGWRKRLTLSSSIGQVWLIMIVYFCFVIKFSCCQIEVFNQLLTFT